jgi:hypothetical protein
MLFSTINKFENKKERNTDHGQATGKLYHLRLRVECTLFVIHKAGHGLSLKKLINYKNYLKPRIYRPVFFYSQTCLWLKTTWNTFKSWTINMFILGALDSQPQVIKFTSCLPMVGVSLRLLLKLKLVAMMVWNIAESDVKHQKSINQSLSLTGNTELLIVLLLIYHICYRFSNDWFW